MLFDVAHQESDYDDADDKCNNASHCKDQQFAAVEYKANPQDVFDQFQQGSADHDRDSQIKSKFRRHAAFQPDEQAADDGGTGTGRAGNQGQQLENAYLDGFLI